MWKPKEMADKKKTVFMTETAPDTVKLTGMHWILSVDNLTLLGRGIFSFWGERGGALCLGQILGEG